MMEDLKKTKHKKYLAAMLAGFGALALGIIVFFIIFRIKEFGGAVGKMVQILQPFIFGGVIAYILRPICNWSERLLKKILPEKVHKIVGPISVAFSLIVGLLFISALTSLVIPQLYSTIMTLYKTLPGKLDMLKNTIGNYIMNNTTLTNNLAVIYETVKDSVGHWVQTEILPRLTNVMSGVGNGALNSIIVIKNLLIGIIVSVYLLAGRHKFAEQGKIVVRSAFKKKWAEFILEEVKYADKQFTGFISGKLFDSIIIGIVTYIFCLILHIPSATLIAVIVGVTNIIPIFGPIIGAIPATVIILVDSPMKALWFVIFTVVLQTVDANVLNPIILGDKVNLSSFWILFSILVFGGLFGFVGMLIGVPLFAVIYDILVKLIRYGLDKHGYDRKTNSYRELTEEGLVADEDSAAHEEQSEVVSAENASETETDQVTLETDTTEEDAAQKL